LMRLPVRAGEEYKMNCLVASCSFRASRDGKGCLPSNSAWRSLRPFVAHQHRRCYRWSTLCPFRVCGRVLRRLPPFAPSEAALPAEGSGFGMSSGIAVQQPRTSLTEGREVPEPCR
jgi:hypothetical protein